MPLNQRSQSAVSLLKLKCPGRPKRLRKWEVESQIVYMEGTSTYQSDQPFINVSAFSYVLIIGRVRVSVSASIDHVERDTF